MIEHIATGIILGVSFGLSPSKQLAIIVSETIHHNPQRGLQAILIQFVTDIPVIAFSAAVAILLFPLTSVRGIILLASGLFVFFRGYTSIKYKGVEINKDTDQWYTLRNILLITISSPCTIFFWLWVGGPIIIDAYAHNRLTAISFILGFYMILIGSRIAIVTIVKRYNTFLSSNVFIFIAKLSGILLIFVAVKFFGDGLSVLKIFRGFQ